MGNGTRVTPAAGLLTVLLLVGACGAAPHTVGPLPSSSAISSPAATSTPQAVPSATAGPSSPRPAATATSTPTPTPSPTPTRTPTPMPAALWKAGDSGRQVRELQHRLRQLDWFSGPITGRYGATTVSGVRGFQEKRRLPVTGAVDRTTWSRLTSMTRVPSLDEMFNRLTPGPALLRRGAEGDRVRDLQARLKQIGWFSGPVSGYYGDATTSAVRGFQAKREIPVTGEVDRRTLDRLAAMTRIPTRDEKHNIAPKPSASGLDRRCLTGRALCISKRTNSLVWVVDGRPQLRFDVRFGSDELPTREGAFSVGWKSRDHVSTIYHTPMPYAMFFSGGQAVHYSPDFAANGYNGASHGCVNVRNLSAIQWLFGQVRVGDKVIVYR